jgi:hypothetical protein
MATDTAAPFTGPRNRESFFDAQRRNRRATWRLSAVCVLATVVMGIPLALTITPLLYAAGSLIAEIVNIWMPLPASFWQRSNEFARYGLLAIQWVTQGKSANSQAVLIGAAVCFCRARRYPLGSGWA